MIQIPCSLVLGKYDVERYVEFAHGIFGDRSFAYDDYSNLRVGRQLSSITWSMEWRAFSRFDIPLSIRALMFDINTGVKDIEAALYQSFMTKLATKNMLHLIIENERNRLRLNSNVNVPSTVDTSSFVGISMGGILGGSYTVVANYSRSALLVSGSPFTYLMGRADLIRIFLTLMEIQFFDRRDCRVALTSLQILMDTFESSGQANSGGYNKSSSSSILLQYALGDSTVSSITSEILLRNINGGNIAPSPKGIELVANNIVAPFYDTSINNGQNPKAYAIQASYPGDYKKVMSSYTSIPMANRVHYCFPRGFSMHYSVVMYIDYGYVRVPCENANGVAVPCIFSDYAKCA